MSEVFEGVLVREPADKLRSAVKTSGTDLMVDISEFSESLAIVYRSDPRSEGLFTERVEVLAESLSRAFGRALLVRYDSRISHRSSKSYKAGSLERSLGEADEIYVLLDDDGFPMTHGRQYARSELAELDPDEEFETLKNAIQVGLELLGDGDWRQLLGLMASC